MDASESRPARCRSCKLLHPVEMKKRKLEQVGTEQLGYGTRTLPQQFWTKSNG